MSQPGALVGRCKAVGQCPGAPTATDLLVYVPTLNGVEGRLFELPVLQPPLPCYFSNALVPRTYL